MKIFKRVLRDPKLRQPFQVFLEQQFCAENLNFYVAVERFREMQFNNESKFLTINAPFRHRNGPLSLGTSTNGTSLRIAQNRSMSTIRQVNGFEKPCNRASILETRSIWLSIR
ncbi:unnamed protein product [Nippostrongylus brasiliensis]|uniref:RGS domain-containing protein n=1 Tax=Nippostrongylus brasiliensis TaxID=27835 RepID=A0A0N4XRI1_NIPBR|nr:unnamed protein product [Nippostrongylus brasiliensis]